MATDLAPLDDPRYQPKHPPDHGTIPFVVRRWGPRSQVRWFRRFRGELRPQPPAVWNEHHPTSELHRGLCCDSCLADLDDGYPAVDDRCCCRSPEPWSSLSGSAR